MLRLIASSLLTARFVLTSATLLGLSLPHLSFAQDSATDEKPDQRAAVPAAEAQKKALGDIKEIFAAEYSKAKKPEEKGVLARTLQKQAEDQKDDVAARYMLFVEAERMALEATDAETALACVESLGKEYQIDEIERLYDALDDLSKKAKTTLVLRGINEANKAAIDKAIAADKFATAVKFCVIGDKLSLAAKDTVERKRYLDTKTAIIAQQKEFEAAERAKEILATNPEDPTANFDRGVYVLSRKQDWEAGLKHLSQCGDAELRVLAKKDLSNPESVKEKLELAEGWFEWTPPMKKLKPAWSKALAKYRYSQIATEVTGLDKTKVEKKLKEIGELPLSRTESGTAVAVSVIKPRIEPKTTTPMRQPMGNAPVVNVPPRGVEIIAQPSPYMRNAFQPLDKEQATIARKVFDLVRSSKSSGGVKTPKFSMQGFSSSSTNPPEEPYIFTHLTIAGVTPEEIKVVDGLKTLDSLVMQSGAIPGEWLKYFTASTYLRSLTIWNDVDLTDENAAVLPKFANLDSLNLTPRSGVPAKAVSAVGGMQKLRHLSLRLTKDIEPNLLASLRNPSVFEVSLQDATEAQILALRGLPALQHLNLTRCEITDKGLPPFAKSLVTNLTFNFCESVTGTGFVGLNASSLKELRITGCKNISPEGMNSICDLPGLTQLQLQSSYSGTVSLKRLRSNQSLSNLALSDVQIEDWDALKNFRSLRVASFGRMELKEEAIKAIAQLPLQSCDLSNVAITDADLKPFMRHPTLQTLTVYSTQVTDEGIKALKQGNPRLNVYK